MSDSRESLSQLRIFMPKAVPRAGDTARTKPEVDSTPGFAGQRGSAGGWRGRRRGRGPGVPGLGLPVDPAGLEAAQSAGARALPAVRRPLLGRPSSGPLRPALPGAGSARSRVAGSPAGRGQCWWPFAGPGDDGVWSPEAGAGLAGGKGLRGEREPKSSQKRRRGVAGRACPEPGSRCPLTAGEAVPAVPGSGGENLGGSLGLHRRSCEGVLRGLPWFHLPPAGMPAAPRSLGQGRGAPSPPHRWGLCPQSPPPPTRTCTALLRRPLPPPPPSLPSFPSHPPLLPSVPPTCGPRPAPGPLRGCFLPSSWALPVESQLQGDDLGRLCLAPTFPCPQGPFLPLKLSCVFLCHLVSRTSSFQRRRHVP
nr:collagen alpha-2(IV) chain-like [Dasypus novemcinctus]